LNWGEEKSVAKEFDWDLIKGSEGPHCISFSKVINSYPARINVWFGRKGRTIGTYINHPKKGKTQLFRKNPSDSEFKAIFKNPRQHTNKGYK